MPTACVRACQLPLLGTQISEGPSSRCSRAVALQAQRRELLSSAASAAVLLLAGNAGASTVTDPTVDGTIARKVFMLEVQTREAIAARELQRAIGLLSELMYFEPRNPQWLEMRGQVCVEGKNWSGSIMDFNEALRWTPSSDVASRARILTGRARALEGQEVWDQALQEFLGAQSLALQSGKDYDPFVVRHIGNCQSSLHRWTDARESYLKSASLLSSSVSSAAADDSAKLRQDHAACVTYAALMLAQLGDVAGAQEELERAKLEGFDNLDTMAALAALYSDAGFSDLARSTWAQGCARFGSAGCDAFGSRDWVARQKRWPPVMVDKLQAFLALPQPLALA